MKITDHNQFNLSEFSERWRKARVSSLVATLGNRGIENRDEGMLLRQISTEDREHALKTVFDYSRKLGSSAARFLGMTLEINDLAEILPSMGVSCFKNNWRPNKAAQVLERGACESLKSSGSFGCDYWREALDGLVMGIGENERLARHRSVGHGDSECVDVLFTEEFAVPRVVSEGQSKGQTASDIRQSEKYGPVPVEITESLSNVRKRFESMKIKLHLDGLSEGVLYYRLEAEEGVLCGAGGKLMHDSFLREMSARYPTLATRDSSPLAVYGGST